jgi:hypothetical protein
MQEKPESKPLAEKPRIYKMSGVWWCVHPSTPYIGGGNNPMNAYRSFLFNNSF